MKLNQDKKKLFYTYIDEVKEATFSGWDFSYVRDNGGENNTPLEWDYTLLLRHCITNATSALDMGTGGGEFLASFHPFPCKMTATESYAPNVPIAQKRLSPLGVTVVGIEESRQEDFSLPFENQQFDLITNRHEDFDSQEVFRLLTPGGIFLTQQVGYQNNENIRMIFGSIREEQTPFLWNRSNAVRFLENAGFEIKLAKEHLGYTRYFDIRAFAYMLKVIPWEFPDFNYDRYEQQLYNIYLKILEDGFFDTTCHRFMVIAVKRKQNS